jgi:metal-responsive CopG/Arc/MetJ family transcriptional regulator
MAKIAYVTIKLPCDIVKDVLDPLVGTHGYSSRTEVIKDALRKLAEKYQVSQPTQ